MTKRPPILILCLPPRPVFCSPFSGPLASLRCSALCLLPVLVDVEIGALSGRRFRRMSSQATECVARSPNLSSMAPGGASHPLCTFGGPALAWGRQCVNEWASRSLDLDEDQRHRRRFRRTDVMAPAASSPARLVPDLNQTRNHRAELCRWHRCSSKAEPWDGDFLQIFRLVPDLKIWAPAQKWCRRRRGSSKSEF